MEKSPLTLVSLPSLQLGTSSDSLMQHSTYSDQAHTHARNALQETRKSNAVAASEEHDLAAGEFANAAQTTTDLEVCRRVIACLSSCVSSCLFSCPPLTRKKTAY